VVELSALPSFHENGSRCVAVDQQPNDKPGWCNASGMLAKKMPTVQTGGQVEFTTQQLLD
jgi:hypothetical protein